MKRLFRLTKRMRTDLRRRAETPLAWPSLVELEQQRRAHRHQLRVRRMRRAAVREALLIAGLIAALGGGA